MQKKTLILGFALLGAVLGGCDNKEKREVGTEEESAPAAREDVAKEDRLAADVLALGYTSEDTKILNAPDFGGQTVAVVEPLQTLQILDTSNAFFSKVRYPQGQTAVEGFVDKVFIARSQEQATLLHEKARRNNNQEVMAPRQ